ncbi:hypothetical protein DN396_29700 [Bacillus sp. BF9-10]|nr:hypothetical protein DN396_29700 [Bacillus sp. BF9-10]
MNLNIVKKERTLNECPFSDLNHFNFNNMYWTPIQILFYHVKLFHTLENMVQIYISIFYPVSF